MIDFQNAVFLKLRPVADNTFSPVIQPMFIPGEEILCSFQTVRDGVVFTNQILIGRASCLEVDLVAGPAGVVGSARTGPPIVSTMADARAASEPAP